MGIAIIGYKGQVANEHNIRANAWQARFNHSVSDVSAFGNRWRRNIGGLIGMDYDFSGFAQDNATETNPSVPAEDVSVFTLTASTGNTYAGESVTQRFVIGTSVEGVAICNGTAIADDEVTETWDMTGS